MTTLGSPHAQTLSPTSRRAMPLIVLLVSLALAFVGSPATMAEADAKDEPIVMARKAASQARVGTSVRVRGKMAGPAGRTVALQLRTRLGGWQNVDVRRTNSRRAYKLFAPSWFGRHRLRVAAPRSGSAPAKISRTFAVKVVMGYKPRGNKRDGRVLFANDSYRWNPCRPVTYRVNTKRGYKKGLRDIKRSFREVGKITGLRFKYKGRSKRIAIKQSNPRGTDILVSFASPRQVRQLRGNVYGYATARGDSQRGLTKGAIALDRTERLSRGTWSNVIRHEIGHTLNIGHAKRRNQLMHGILNQRRQAWGAGDLRMLSRLGASSGCWSSAPRSARIPVSDEMSGALPSRVGRNQDQ